MRTLSSRSGFTLTELLVVISIIGVLAAISIPAVMVARNQAQKVACSNNLKNIGVAITGYHSSKDKYPPSFYTRNDPTGTARTLNWSIAILEELEQAPLADRIKADPRIIYNPPPLGELFPFEKYICPMDDIETLDGALSYAANMGIRDEIDPSHSGSGHTFSRDPMGKGSGIFYDRVRFRNGIAVNTPSVTMRSDDVYDGLSQTIMVAERSNPATGVSDGSMSATFWDGIIEAQVGLVWRPDEFTLDAAGDLIDPDFTLTTADLAAGNYVGFGQYVNATNEGDPYAGATQLDFARPASYHGGVVNVLFCDGSVKGVRDDIDYGIYSNMMTSDSRVLPAGVRGTGVAKESEF